MAKHTCPACGHQFETQGKKKAVPDNDGIVCTPIDDRPGYWRWEYPSGRVSVVSFLHDEKRYQTIKRKHAAAIMARLLNGAVSDVYLPSGFTVEASTLERGAKLRQDTIAWRALIEQAEEENREFENTLAQV